MTKKEVLEASKKYMLGIRRKVGLITTKRVKIEDMELELRTAPAPFITHYGGTSNSNSDDNSPTSRELARREYLKKNILKEKKLLNKLEKDLLKARLFIDSKKDICHIREWQVLEALYFDCMTQQQTARKMKCSSAMVGIIDKKALLSIGSVMLGLRVDNEYYNENGLYIDFTAKQKRRIQEGL